MDRYPGWILMFHGQDVNGCNHIYQKVPNIERLSKFPLNSETKHRHQLTKIISLHFTWDKYNSYSHVVFFWPPQLHTMKRHGPTWDISRTWTKKVFVAPVCHTNWAAPTGQDLASTPFGLQFYNNMTSQSNITMKLIGQLLATYIENMI